MVNKFNKLFILSTLILVSGILYIQELKIENSKLEKRIYSFNEFGLNYKPLYNAYKGTDKKEIVLNLFTKYKIKYTLVNNTFKFNTTIDKSSMNSFVSSLLNNHIYLNKFSFENNMFKGEFKI